ncbi:alpha/beta fold hydrolase [Sphingomonas sp. BK345]|uniref:alpha/beta fold hydrolase n=1 Tax=Sphingomonas sp. BK345 TaxID=2586980 RepID=UPI001611AA71|nr:alpha/beta fold hydrolase [Sphingomonas sp. BK345]MBB3473965.1 homoserine O-acetyltransferase [Sphingomonas sp. BK345]
MIRSLLALIGLAASPALAQQQGQRPPITAAAPQPAAARIWPTREADAELRDVTFAAGGTMARVRLHYTTLGTPHRDSRGEIDNAVMVLHGTGGTGKQFLQPQFADALYGPGQPLDITRYYVILPDNIGHGGSSKPSDGMGPAFPRYDYDDMVALQHRLVTETLGIKRLRLLMGTSMGCMHALQWGERWPDAARALMPLGCEAVQIAGLNRMWRQLAIESITADPAYAGGRYQAQPLAGLRGAAALLFVAGGAPIYLQDAYPTRDAAADYARQRVAASLKGLDANDLIWALDSSRSYDPWPRLEAITAPLTWINSADDFINPRALDYPDRAVKRMRDARFRLIPESVATRGHGSHTWARLWKDDLVALLARSAPR